MRSRRIFWTTVVLIALCLWGFAEIAAEVLEQGTPAVDRTIIQFMRQPAGADNPVGPPWVEKVIRDIDGMGGFFPLTYVSLSVFVGLLLWHRKMAALLLAVTVAGGGGLSLLCKMMVNRPRPEVVAHGAAFTSSFPSGHSLMAMVIYLTLGALLAGRQPNRLLRFFVLLVAFFLAVLIGLSRIYLGAHWPTDVLAGWLLGLAWTLLAWLVARWLQRRGTLAEDLPIP